jgi:hypothetical protein
MKNYKTHPRVRPRIQSAADRRFNTIFFPILILVLLLLVSGIVYACTPDEREVARRTNAERSDLRIELSRQCRERRNQPYVGEVSFLRLQAEVAELRAAVSARGPAADEWKRMLEREMRLAPRAGNGWREVYANRLREAENRLEMAESGRQIRIDARQNSINALCGCADCNPVIPPPWRAPELQPVRVPMN